MLWFFEGNSASRSRLYRIQINNYRHLWEKEYEVEIISKHPNEILFSISEIN